MGGAGGSVTSQGIGAPCEDETACDGAVCLAEADSGWPGGYCSDVCAQAVACPDDSACISFPNGDNLCLASCDLANGDADCNTGYSCFDVGMMIGVCVPACDSDAQCKTLPMCNVDEGLCVDKEICDDTIDNDLDGATDCSDSECAVACQGPIDMACSNAMVLTASIMGDTTGGTNLFEADCTGPSAPEDIYTYTAMGDGQLTLNFTSGMVDMGVYVRSTCNDAGTQIACANAVGDDALSIPVKMGETLVIFVDGYSAAADAGPYTLDVIFQQSAPEVCDDAIDNDFDQLYDCDDTDCAMTCGPLQTTVCAAAVALAAGVDHMGDTSMGSNLFSGTCTGDEAAKENVLSFAAVTDGELTLVLNSATDQGIYTRTNCTDAMTEAACIDVADGGSPETLVVGLTAGSTLNVFIDGFTPMSAGPYTLTPTFVPAVCGDNTTTQPEQCDDGDPLGMDGCDAMCKYTAQAETEPNNDSMTANAVFEGKVTAGITPAMDNDWFKVTVPMGATKITATTGPAGMATCMSENGATGQIDTEIQILASNGMTELAFNEDINGAVSAAGNYCSTAQVAMLAPGDYFVRASASTTYCAMCTFDYSVIISVDP
jgi:cysteine-rich repeat protein